MGGMIGLGQDYQKNALSGFARVSAQEQEREQANKQMDAAQTQAAVSTGMSALGMIAALALL